MRNIKTVFCLLMVGVAISPAEGSEPVSQKITVNEAVQEALKKNPIMRESQADIDAAKASKQSALADMLPQASFNYGYTYLREKPTQFDIQVASQDQYAWDVTVIQPLFAGFALKSNFDLTRLNIGAQKLEKEQTRLDLIRQVKAACYNLLLSQKLLAVRNEEVQALTAHKHDAELIYEQGLVRMNDVLKAEVSLADATQGRELARAQLQKTKMSLNRLLQRPLGTELQIDAPTPQTRLHFDSEELAQNALLERPLIKLLDNSLEQLGLSRKLTRSSYYPTLSLFGRYEQNGDEWTATENDYSNYFNTSVGITAEWKFWRSGKTGADVRRVKKEIEALSARIDLFKDQVVEEVNHAVLDCEVAQSNIETASKSLAQAEENWRITQKQYKHQIATSTDVLDARTYLSGADTNYYTAVYAYLDAVAALDRAVGQSSSE